MTTGQKIKELRQAKNLSQKELGIMSGLSEPAIRNYELGNRTPSPQQLEKIAAALNVSVYAISDPEIEDYNGVLHTLFQLEEMYGLTVGKIDGVVCLKLDGTKKNGTLAKMLPLWNEKKEQLSKGEISEEEYVSWCKRYPMSHAEECQSSIRVKRRTNKSEGNS